MARFSDMIITYLVIGAVMFGGGAVQFDDAGVANWFVERDDSGDVEAASNSSENLDGTGGAIKSVIDMVAGPILLIYNLVVGLFTYLNWPIFVLASNNAPPMMILLLGVPFSAGFYLSIIRLWRTSA